ncbi:MAG: hypothetical protein A2V75_02105, partial [Actinobacteria bacterium RBG_16_70_17]
MRALSGAAARRMAIASQGLADPRPSGRVDLRHLRKVFGRVGALQLDPINVVERAPHLTLFARLGPHDRDLLWRAYNDRRELIEYWAHQACLLPVEAYPLFRHRMEGKGQWREVRALEAEHPGYLEEVLEEVRRRGPLAAAELEEPGERHVPYWGSGWTAGKLALEWLFVTGRLVVGERRGLVRRYDLPERVIPRQYLEAPAPPREEAQRLLLLRAARSLGVGTASDLAGYYGLPIKEARAAVDVLAAEGALDRVEVEGWRDPAFRHPEADAPRRVRAAALLCPFDSLIWDRGRTERLFAFRYRTEIYTPAARRVWGYYVLPFLLGDRLVARLDLKADRERGVLVAPAAFLQPGEDPG